MIRVDSTYMYIVQIHIVFPLGYLATHAPSTLPRCQNHGIALEAFRPSSLSLYLDASIANCDFGVMRAE